MSAIASALFMYCEICEVCRILPLSSIAVLQFRPKCNQFIILLVVMITFPKFHRNPFNIIHLYSPYIVHNREKLKNKIKIE